MTQRSIISLIILGLAGILFAFGDLLIPQENVLFDATKRPQEFASLVTSHEYSLWAFRGFIGVIMEMVGTVGLYLYLQKSKSERLAFYGLLVTLVHHIFGMGVFALAFFLFPALGSLYMEGNLSATAFASMEGPLGIFFFLSLLSTLLGLGIMATAIYKSGMLPKWSGWLAFLGFFLIPFPGVILQVLTNLLWGAAYLWMAYHIWKQNKVSRLRSSETVIRTEPSLNLI